MLTKSRLVGQAHAKYGETKWGGRADKAGLGCLPLGAGLRCGAVGAGHCYPDRSAPSAPIKLGAGM